MRISVWSSYVCSSDLLCHLHPLVGLYQGIARPVEFHLELLLAGHSQQRQCSADVVPGGGGHDLRCGDPLRPRVGGGEAPVSWRPRSEEHTSELQSLMRISYAVFCLKKKRS